MRKWALLGSLASLIARSVAQDSSSNLIVSFPYCDHYQCQFPAYQGGNFSVNWLSPPVGSLVNVSLVARYGDNMTTYVLAANYPAVSEPGYCDAGDGVGVVIPGVPCGRVEVIIPTSIPVGLYTTEVQDVNNTANVGFTDLINLMPPNSTSSVNASASASASASSSASGSANVSIALSTVTISGPYSTDSAKAQSPGYSTPSPTAVSGSSGSSAASSTSSASADRALAAVSSTADARSGGGRLQPLAVSAMGLVLAAGISLVR